MTSEKRPRTAGDEARIAGEEAEAAREAARIGGRVRPESEDPASQPLAQGGGGEAEGFELAERELEENAGHGDSRGFPEGDRPQPEEPTEAEYGEADEPIPSDGSPLSRDEER